MEAGAEKRIQWVDTVKGTGILLIVLALSMRPEMRDAQIWCRWIYDFICSFTMGMFFVISDYTYRLSETGRPQNRARFARKKSAVASGPFFRLRYLDLCGLPDCHASASDRKDIGAFLLYRLQYHGISESDAIL